MQPRRTDLLANLSGRVFLEQVAKGMRLIAKHMEQLEQAAQHLVKAENARGVAAVRVFALEEAAKYLILVDAVRCGRSNQARLARHLRRCHDHLAKGVYAEVCEINPADFAEVIRFAETTRRSHYLDGPNDADWIFSNEISASRERSLYVDYMHSDNGDDWWEPSASEHDLNFMDITPAAIRLVRSMERARFSSPQALGVVRAHWDGVVPTPEQRWLEIRSLNVSTIQDLAEMGLGNEMEREELLELIDTWTFPLHHADLAMIPVDQDELRELQRKIFAGLGP